MKTQIDHVTAQLRAEGKPYVLATVVRSEAPSSAKGGDRAILDREGILAGWIGGGCAKPAVTRNARDALDDGRTRLIRISRNLDNLEKGILGYPMTCQSGGTLDIFIEPIMPNPLLTIIGHSLIAETLCNLAAQVGFDVIVAAPDGNRERFSLARDWLNDLDQIAELKPAPQVIVVATQGSGDARGLEAALATGAPYIGLIASPKKSARLKQTLKERGLDAATVDSIDAPAGIYIGATTPQEVAISVLAELVKRRRLDNVATTSAEESHTDDEASACCSQRESTERK